MALIKFGSIITDSRGSIGGHTFKWSRFGNVALPKPQTAKLLTQRQSIVRSNFARFSKHWWQTLTPTQRTDWRALAAANPRPNTWGDQYPLTGHALYIGLNQLLTQASLAPTNDAPSDQFVETVATATLSITAPATASLAFTPTPAPADHILYASATGPLSPGVENADGRFLFLAASPLSQTSPWDLSFAYFLLTGTLLPGRSYFLKVHFLNSNNGALSPPVLARTLAT